MKQQRKWKVFSTLHNVQLSCLFFFVFLSLFRPSGNSIVLLLIIKNKIDFRKEDEREKKKLFPKPQFTSSTNFMKIIRYNYFDMYKIGNFTFFPRCLLAFNTYCEWIYIWKCNTLFVITLEWTKIILPREFIRVTKATPRWWSTKVFWSIFEPSTIQLFSAQKR